MHRGAGGERRHAGLFLGEQKPAWIEGCRVIDLRPITAQTGWKIGTGGACQIDAGPASKSDLDQQHADARTRQPPQASVAGVDPDTLRCRLQVGSEQKPQQYKSQRVLQGPYEWKITALLAPEAEAGQRDDQEGSAQRIGDGARSELGKPPDQGQHDQACDGDRNAEIAVCQSGPDAPGELHTGIHRMTH